VLDHITFITSRVNTVSGLTYSEDPASFQGHHERAPVPIESGVRCDFCRIGSMRWQPTSTGERLPVLSACQSWRDHDVGQCSSKVSNEGTCITVMPAHVGSVCLRSSHGQYTTVYTFSFSWRLYLIGQLQTLPACGYTDSGMHNSAELT
jgi:hypothetical protein